MTLKAVCFVLMYTNHAVNFYLYCITGRKFRWELKDLFVERTLIRCRRRQAHHDGNGTGVGGQGGMSPSISLAHRDDDGMDADGQDRTSHVNKTQRCNVAIELNAQQPSSDTALTAAAATVAARTGEDYNQKHHF